MKILFIGGTGTISSAISSALSEQDHELYLLNRGNRNDKFSNAHQLIADINNEEKVASLINHLNFDVVANFIAYSIEDVERDYRLFKNKTKQYIFISSASVYHKPAADYRISESTSLANPFWEYSRKKIECEDYLMQLYRNEKFPVTIIRPSHTYGERSIPLGVHGGNSWQVIKRMLDGKQVIIHGDGTSLWTMTHSRDFAKAFIGLLNNIHAIGEAVQITSDETLTWNQIYECIAGALGVPLKAVHVSSEFLNACGDYDYQGTLIGDKANSVVFDNTKLKRLVPGFTATIRFDQEVKETIEYVLSHKECQIADEKFDAWCDKLIEVLNRAAREIKSA